MPQQKLESVEDLAAKAKALRRDVLLQVYKAQSGHPGGSLSWIDIGVALYYRQSYDEAADAFRRARHESNLAGELYHR